MRRLTIALAAFGLIILSGTAQAFQCPSDFKQAQEAIDDATKAMEAMPDGTNKGLVHTLIDDAKATLASGEHNHAKPAAGAYDHARAIAKARSATAYAEAAEMLATR